MTAFKLEVNFEMRVLEKRSGVSQRVQLEAVYMEHRIYAVFPSRATGPLKLWNSRDREMPPSSLMCEKHA